MKLSTLVYTSVIGVITAAYIPGDEVAANRYLDIQGRLILGDLQPNQTLVLPPPRVLVPSPLPSPAAPTSSTDSRDAMVSFYSILKYFKNKKRGKYDDVNGNYEDSDGEYCSSSDDEWYDGFDDMEDDCEESEDDYDPFYEYDYDSDYDDFDDMFGYYKVEGNNSKRTFLKYVLNKERLREKKLFREIRKITNSTLEPVRGMIADLGVSTAEAENLVSSWYKFYHLLSPLKTKLINKILVLDMEVKAANAKQASEDGATGTGTTRSRKGQKNPNQKSKAQKNMKKSKNLNTKSIKNTTSKNDTVKTKTRKNQTKRYRNQTNYTLVNYTSPVNASFNWSSISIEDSSSIVQAFSFFFNLAGIFLFVILM